MAASILIIGGTKEQVKTKVLEVTDLSSLKENPDLKLIGPLENKNTIGIDQIRDCNDFIHQKPFAAKRKFAVFLQAEKITPQAQNALLKTLEEPPAYAQIILCSKTENALLETVVSRCKKVQGLTHKKVETALGQNPFLSMKMGDRLGEVQKLAALDRDELIEKFESWIEESRGVLIKNADDANLRNSAAEDLKLLTEVKESIENTNVNVRLALEYLSVNLN